MSVSATEMSLLASHCITWSLVWQLKDRPIQGKYFFQPARLLKGIHFMSRKSLSSQPADSRLWEFRKSWVFPPCREIVVCPTVPLNVQCPLLPSTPSPLGKGEQSLRLTAKVYVS
uniref:Uncharacterized protein n=1 Tax=Mus musculus TaxID=10090 RepID=Q8CCF3_MOUSE|nr:unnamed protein product [Mus musculus]